MGFIQIMIGTAEGNFGGFLIPFLSSLHIAIKITKNFNATHQNLRVCIEI